MGSGSRRGAVGRGPGQASRRRAVRSSRRGRIAGGSPPTGTHSDQTPLVWRTPEGPEGTGRLRDNAPRHTPACQSPPMWRAPEGLAAVPVGGGGACRGTGGRGPGRASRRRAERSSRRGRPGPTAHGTPAAPQATQAGRPPPTGTPSSPAQQHTTRRPEHQRGHKQHSTGARARRPAPLDATTQTRVLRSTCVPCRSARAARRWMRSSRSLRLRRRAGPRR